VLALEDVPRMQRATPRRSWRARTCSTPALDSSRDDPRFQALLERLAGPGR
jgi:hypothetical protein